MQASRFSSSTSLFSVAALTLATAVIVAFLGCSDGGAQGPAGQCQEDRDCDPGETCNASGQCDTTCTPQCSGKQCGPDGCGGQCSPGCSSGQTCNVRGQCVTFATDGYASISAGTFSMGSPSSESCREADETEHQVTLTRSFELQRTEVTQTQFQALMGYNPSSFASCGVNCPVEMVSWHEAVAYCNALSVKAALDTCYTCAGSGASVTCDTKDSYAGSALYTCPGYRLPTEAEWEFAYRAGTTTAYHSGINDPAKCFGCSTPDANDANLATIAWYCANSSSTPHAVGQKSANAWGLYDMAGNVWEWVHDWYYATYPQSVTDPAGRSFGTRRAKRGGSWASDPRSTRAANRASDAPVKRYKLLGFRCARTK